MNSPQHTTPADERLWQFTLHEDDVFNGRQNLFLVAESMLVVAYTTALDASSGHASATTIATAGLLLTILWLYAGARHALIVDLVQKEAKSRFPDYEELCSLRKWRLFPIRSRAVTTYAVPVLIAALWGTLLAAQPGNPKPPQSSMHAQAAARHR